jgi:secretion/DNA translocation related CpaE-like protein
VPATPAARPLLVTADPVLLDDLLRLCAAAGVEPEVAADAAGARRSWASAPLVLVGADVAGGLDRQPLTRRPGVLLVGRDLDDSSVWQRAVRVGAEQVLIVPDADGDLVERIAAAVEGDGVEAPIVCWVGGRGGAGASTLAAALAVTAARRGLGCLLVDGDPLGGGIDMILGGEDAAGLRWPELAAARGRVNGVALRDALPQLGGLTVLSCDRGDTLSIPADAMRAVLGAGRRGNDLVVVDLPRRLDAATEEALSAAGLVLLVVPAEVRAAAAAARVAAAVSAVASPLQVVVRGPSPSGLSAALIASSLGLPLAGYLPPEPRLAEALERGEPPASRGRGPLAKLCGDLLDELVPDLGEAA